MSRFVWLGLLWLWAVVWLSVIDEFRFGQALWIATLVVICVLFLERYWKNKA